MKNSKVIIFFVIAIALIAIKPLYNSFVITRTFEKLDIVALGKTLDINVSEESTRDYTFVEINSEFSKWNESEKNKFISHMKDNNLILKPGNYTLSQGTKWEKALEIFKFE